MIHHADAALEQWFRDATTLGKVDVDFGAPPTSTPKTATIRLVLAAVREQDDRRDHERRDIRDGDGRVVGRQPSMRYFELDYACVVEGPHPRTHEVLGGLLQLLVDHDTIPAEHLPDPLGELGIPIELSLVAPGGAPPGASTAAGIVMRIVLPVQPTEDRQIGPPAVELHLEMVPPPGAKAAVRDDERDDTPEPLERKWTTVRRRERIAPPSGTES